MNLRLCTPADAAAIAAIYAPFCADGFVSFETTPPSTAEMAARIEKITARRSWLVAETADGRVAGYVYASPHRERAAYRWAVDVAAYPHADHRRRGLGRALYTALFAVLRALHYFKAYAGIALPNAASVALHERMGMSLVGVYRGVGYKAGAWRDVGWWQLDLQPELSPPPEPRGVREVLATPLWTAAVASGERLLTPVR